MTKYTKIIVQSKTPWITCYFQGVIKTFLFWVYSKLLQSGKHILALLKKWLGLSRRPYVNQLQIFSICVSVIFIFCYNDYLTYIPWSQKLSSNMVLVHGCTKQQMAILMKVDRISYFSGKFGPTSCTFKEKRIKL